ncbi:MAG: hypothetical protein KUG58_11795 [Marinosulfonomonas sp.]|nr:hypothetical protein [Marinosulfonomonas sp.]
MQTAVARVQALAASGGNPAPHLALLEKARQQVLAGQAKLAEATLDQALLALSEGAQGKGGAPGAVLPVLDWSNEKVTQLYTTPQKVKIRGYDGSVMEPFISYDGQVLLFNNANTEQDTDLHLARRIGDLEFQYIRVLEETRSDVMEAAPSLDINGRLYFTSLREYFQTKETIFLGQLEGDQVVGIDVIRDQVTPARNGLLNMDVSVSPAGDELYISAARFAAGSNTPRESNIQVARQVNGRFMIDRTSARLFAKVNSDALEYAPSISEDGLELYFTRASQLIAKGSQGGKLRIMVARRKNRSAAFEEPRVISAISGFVEAPTLTGDRRYLYYHARDAKGVLSLYRVTRQ